MALNLTKLTEDIQEAFDDPSDKENEKMAAARAQMAKKIATAIDTYVKKVTITYTTGLSSPSGGGAVTGTFQYSIS